VWLFSGVANTRWIALFLAGYAIVPWLTVFVPSFGFYLWKERHREHLVGLVGRLTKEKLRWGDSQRVAFVLERQDPLRLS
jgi:hypothetical protein